MKLLWLQLERYHEYMEEEFIGRIARLSGVRALMFARRGYEFGSGELKQRYDEMLGDKADPKTQELYAGLPTRYFFIKSRPIDTL